MIKVGSNLPRQFVKCNLAMHERTVPIQFPVSSIVHVQRAQNTINRILCSLAWWKKLRIIKKCKLPYRKPVELVCIIDMIICYSTLSKSLEEHGYPASIK